MAFPAVTAGAEDGEAGDTAAGPTLSEGLGRAGLADKDPPPELPAPSILSESILDERGSLFVAILTQGQSLCYNEDWSISFDTTEIMEAVEKLI